MHVFTTKESNPTRKFRLTLVLMKVSITSFQNRVSKDLYIRFDNTWVESQRTHDVDHHDFQILLFQNNYLFKRSCTERKKGFS